MVSLRHAAIERQIFFCTLVFITNVQGLQQTAQLSTLIALNPSTATQPLDLPPTQSPLNLTLVYPAAGVKSSLPWIMLMTGANCYSQDYSFLEQQLAGRGYLVAIIDELHPVTPDTQAFISPVREPQCPNNSWGAVSATALNDVHTFLASALHQNPNPATRLPPIPVAAQSAIKSVDLDSVVLLGHSLGGQVAVNILAGICDEPEEFLCGDYAAVLDSKGKSAIKGVISYEGFALANNTAFTEVAIPDDTFVTYITDPDPSIANLTRAAYEMTEGECVQYIELGSTSSHYSINDWNLATAPHQRAPCALDNGASTTVSTQAEHDALLLFISDLADNVIRAQMLNDTAAAMFLTGQVPDSLFVQSAELTPECYKDFM
ncbi:hypothetical protein WJX82_010791 [Trebouxia sp. C0006]